MIQRYDYKGTCWWCGSIANSAEHKYKKSDLVREFGHGPYEGDREIVRGVEQQLRKIQGPSSKEVTFDRNICQKCNNEKSQSFDRAYEAFIVYIKNHETDIYTSKQFKFSDIFGVGWQIGRDNVIRYYVKHICCRLANNGILIRDEIRDYLNDKNILQFINLYMEVREDIIALINSCNVGGLWIGSLGYKFNKKTGIMSDIESFIGYRWLRTNYVYDEDILNPVTNLFNDIVILGSDYNVDPKMIRSSI